MAMKKFIFIILIQLVFLSGLNIWKPEAWAGGRGSYSCHEAGRKITGGTLGIDCVGKDGIPKVIEVVGNDGEPIVYGSVLNQKENDVNLAISKGFEGLIRLISLRNLAFDLYADNSAIEPYHIPIDAISIKEKIINKKTRVYLVVNISKLQSFHNSETFISPSSLPNNNYRLRITKNTSVQVLAALDITTAAFTYYTPAIVAGKVISNGSALVSIEDLSGNKISDGTVTTDTDGTFITEVRANQLIPKEVKVSNLIKTKNAEGTNLKDVTNQTKTTLVHAVTNKDLFAVLVLSNDPESNAKISKNPIEINDSTTLAANFAKQNNDLTTNFTSKQEETKCTGDNCKENSQNSDLNNIDCNIKQFSSLCNLDDEKILTSIGESFKKFLQSVTCNFSEFELIKKVILATPDTTNVSIGRGYCEFFGRTVNENKPCDVYTEILKGFKSGNISKLPCPPIFCDKFKDIKPPKCFFLNDFCEEQQADIVCTKSSCPTQSCIKKPIKDLFCKIIGTEISEKECTTNEDGTPSGNSTAKSDDGTIYCISSTSSPDTATKECKLKDCHKKCEEIVPGEPPFVYPPGAIVSHVCDKDELVTEQNPCKCADRGSVINGKCTCPIGFPTYTKDGCKRICSPGEIDVDFSEAILCECIAPATFSGIIDLGKVEAGNHTIELEAEGKTEGCNFGNLTSWSGTATVRTSINQCDSSEGLCSSNKTTSQILVNCTSIGQLCSPRHKFTVSILKPTPLEFEYKVGDLHCSPIKLSIYVDSKLTATTPFLGYPGGPPPLSIGGRGICECPNGKPYTDKGCGDTINSNLNPAKPNDKNLCHLKCDADVGKRVDCSNPDSEFFSIKCCDPKTQNTVIITDPNEGPSAHLGCSDLGGTPCGDAGRINKKRVNRTSLDKKPIKLDPKDCLCNDPNNFNEKGFVKKDAQNQCKDKCPEGFEKDPNKDLCLPICKEGFVRTAEGQCKKQEGGFISNENICPAGTGPSKTIPCKCKEPATPTGIGNECVCEKEKVYVGQKGCINKEATDIPICEKGQFKSVIILCKCAPGADFGDDGLCKCLNGKSYSIKGCGDTITPTPTPKPSPIPSPIISICLSGAGPSVENNCVCAKGSTPTGINNSCVCPDGQKYTVDGCTILPTPTPTPSPTPSPTPTSSPTPSPTSTPKPTNFCSTSQASTSDNPCTCKGTATATGPNGTCKCSNGAEYSLTFGGCGD